jgi:hypothetical protein
MKTFKIVLLVGELVETLEVWSSNSKSASRFAIAFFQRTTNSLIKVKKCEEVKNENASRTN